MTAPHKSETSNRKIKPHRKSRRGCSNCKLRSVKCDECKPHCKRCLKYGVICCYDGSSPDLQLSVGEAAPILIFAQALPYWPNKDAEIIGKFQARTALTVSSGKRLQLYQNEITDLAGSTQSLRYAIFALTLMHERHLLTPSNTKLSVDEAKYLCQATSSLKRELARYQPKEQAAAICTAAALLGNLTFCQIEAKVPQDAWPLATPTVSDLDWLKMSEGKTQVWSRSQSIHEDPVFGPLVGKFDVLSPPVTPSQAPFIAFPEEFVSLYELATNATLENRYFRAASILGGILHSQSPIVIMLSFWSFVGNMDPAYRQLLEWKEPRALLLLTWWFAKLSELPIWWLHRRTILEGQAMCIYLEQHASYDAEIQILLSYPKSVFANSQLELDV